MTEMKQNTQKIKTENNNSNDEIDLARLFGMLLDSKWLIIFVTAAFTFIGVVYALMATPVYKADALIQIEEKTSGLPGVADLEAMLGGEHDPETEMALLKSRRVLSYAVDSLNLEIVSSPKYKGSLGKFFARRYGANIEGKVFNQPMVASLFDDSFAWGGEQIKVSTFNVAPSYLDKTFELIHLGKGEYTLSLDEEQILKGKTNQLAQTSSGSIELLITDIKSSVGTGFYVKRLYREDIIGSLQKNLGVAGQGKDTGILVATYEGEKRQHVEDVLHAVTQGFLLQNVQRMSAEIQNSIDYLKSELPVYKGQLEAAEAKLNQYRLENKSVDLSIETQSILDQAVALDTRIHELSFKEAEISQRFTKEHPSYISLNKKKKELLDQKDSLTQSVQGLPETQQQVLRLARDVEVNQQIYLYMLNKNQELRVAKAGTVGNIQIVDESVVGRKPIKPKKPLIVVLATLLGGMFSVAFVLVKGAFHRGVTNPQDFEEIGLTVYATIPLSDTQSKFLDKKKLKEKMGQKLGRKKLKSKEILVAKLNPTDIAIEAIRSLRTSLHFAMLEAKNNVVMISGASPGVGKSFISSNLAAVLAQAGQKILLIDADMRKGYTHKVFNHKVEDGLSELLVGDIDFEKAAIPTDIDNLTLITRGPVPPNPSELLMGENFTKMLAQASKDYDLVLIDTPPILAVTDPSIIGHHAGTSFLLARFDQSSLKEIAAAANRFDLNGIDIKGVIFNAVEKKASSYYGDYGYYNYEYKNK